MAPTNSSSMRLVDARLLATRLADGLGFGEGFGPIGLSWNEDKQKVAKRPLTPHGFRDWTSDPDEIKRQYANHLPLHDGETFGTGLYSGVSVLVLDVDVPEALAELESEDGQLPGLRVSTVSGGTHIYEWLPDGVEVGNSPGRLPQGIDVRSVNGFVVAPGTWCPWGSWEIVDGTEMADAPDWLLDLLLTPKPVASSDSVSFDRGSAPLTETGGAPIIEGGRNYALFREARSMNRRGWGKQAAYEALCVFNEHYCSPPHADSEVRRALDSAYSRYDQGRSDSAPVVGVSAWD